MNLRIMKRLLFTLLLVIITLGAEAQSARNVLELDSQSFTPEQTGVLKDVNIDPIAKDRSKRACARLKIRLNRMTKEEIAALEVRLPGGNVELVKREVASEGNGLILELTAKPQTRIYLHHPKFGDSNEVSLNLEGEKVYIIDGQLNLLLPITVVSNVKGADVYLDGVFKGQLNDAYMLTIEDVVPTNHTITIKHGAAAAEKVVNVTSNNVSFRVEVDDQTSQPQYVVFELDPKFATLFIDDEMQTTQDGFVTAVLKNGVHSWRAQARGYHPLSGQVTVSGEKVVRRVSLTIDAAIVTVTTAADAEIWVNDQKKGVGSWQGALSSGVYIFEARKAGHRTTKLSQTVSSASANQSVVLEAPKPIYGTLDINSTPALASVKVDGKAVGETPLMTKLLEGSHRVEVTKAGYNPWSEDVAISDGKTTSVVAQLKKIPTPTTPTATQATTTSTTTSAATPATTTYRKKYKVGDYYSNGSIRGIVFWVDPSGSRGKIIHCNESLLPYQWTSDGAEMQKIVGTFDAYEGARNMKKIKQIEGWKSKYPAFGECAWYGEGWYLPAIEELKMFTHNESVRTLLNSKLKSINCASIPSPQSGRGYWSSTECNKYNDKRVYTSLPSEQGKGMKHYIRAVAAVTFWEEVEKPTTTTTATTTASSSVAQNDDDVDDEIYNTVETMPRFEDGESYMFFRWMRSHVQYPAEARDNGIAGRVLFTFVVERDGSVSNVRIIKSPHQSLSDEAIRVALSSPKWEPGKQRGQAVRVKLAMSVEFKK